MTDKQPDKIHYSLTAIDGYQAIFRIILGARGVGKTFALKIKALSIDGCCMWVRRYENELNKCMEQFVPDLVKDAGYDADDFEYVKDVLYYRGEPKIYFQALSLANKIKSSSYPDVRILIYDEFIIEKTGHSSYLPDEDRKLLDLYSTVFRDRYGIVYMAANNISFINPFFLSDGFNVTDFDERFKVFGPLDPGTGAVIRDEVTNNPYVVVEKYDNEYFKEHMKQTPYGRFISHIQYGQYALENKTLLDNDAFIMPIPERAYRQCNLRIGNLYIGMYHAYVNDTRILYFDDSYNPEQDTFTPRQGMKDGERVLLRGEYPFIIFCKWTGGMYFKDKRTKGIIEDIITTCYFR